MLLVIWHSVMAVKFEEAGTCIEKERAGKCYLMQKGQVYPKCGSGEGGSK